MKIREITTLIVFVLSSFFMISDYQNLNEHVKSLEINNDPYNLKMANDINNEWMFMYHSLMIKFITTIIVFTISTTLLILDVRNAKLKKWLQV